MAISPTQLSLKMMRDQGYYAEVVERYNSFTRKRNDLCGFIDVLCLRPGEVVALMGRNHPLGIVLAVLAWLPPNWRIVLAGLALMAATVLVNLAPAD